MKLSIDFTKKQSIVAYDTVIYYGKNHEAFLSGTYNPRTSYIYFDEGGTYDMVHQEHILKQHFICERCGEPKRWFESSRVSLLESAVVESESTWCRECDNEAEKKNETIIKTSKPVPDKIKVIKDFDQMIKQGLCPECESKIIYQSGCKICPACAWSMCG